ncbi:hypothetical protein H648_41609gpHYPp1 [Human mastadenovirus D]|uniref:Uncharacterized protein n=1 Tax=Human mastadenovirus D TaxID=130310 RepID=T1UKA0_9ADEN|nr:hypothetical protein H648_41609gpHYPp1 [Human mastadenovirus D]
MRRRGTCVCTRWKRWTPWWTTTATPRTWPPLSWRGRAPLSQSGPSFSTRRTAGRPCKTGQSSPSTGTPTACLSPSADTDSWRREVRSASKRTGENWFLTPSSPSSPGSLSARPSAPTAERMLSPPSRSFSHPSSTPCNPSSVPPAGALPRASSAPRATPPRPSTTSSWSTAISPTRRAKTVPVSAPAG